jgi:hypothetical protein
MWKEDRLRKQREATARWRQRNPEKVKASSEKWKAKNKEKIRENLDRFKKEWAENNPHGLRRQAMKKYGLTLEQYEEMFFQQGGLCVICNEAPNGRNLHVDHDHHTGRVRGLLCNACNAGIGHLQDDPNLLRRAVSYLEQHS